MSRVYWIHLLLPSCLINQRKWESIHSSIHPSTRPSMERTRMAEENRILLDMTRRWNRLLTITINITIRSECIRRSLLKAKVWYAWIVDSTPEYGRLEWSDCEYISFGKQHGRYGPGIFLEVKFKNALTSLHDSVRGGQITRVVQLRKCGIELCLMQNKAHRFIWIGGIESSIGRLEIYKDIAKTLERKEQCI